MITKISKSRELLEKLEEEGKVNYNNTPEDVQAMLQMDKKFDSFRRRFRIKERNSNVSASKIVLNA